MRLVVSIERNGVQCLAGYIEGTSGTDAAFRYDESYLNDPDAAPISISLPKQEQAFTEIQTKNGYLPACD